MNLVSSHILVRPLDTDTDQEKMSHVGIKGKFSKCRGRLYLEKYGIR